MFSWYESFSHEEAGIRAMNQLWKQEWQSNKYRLLRLNTAAEGGS